jgi:protein KTI12
MPLVSLCGFPCSGKSTRAAELKEFISKNHPSLSCKIITDDGNSDEKKLRGIISFTSQTPANLLSLVERELTATTVLILDSSNFIKGFRYQLYCIAKQNSTPHCLLYTACPATLSKTRNESRETPYSDFVMEDLITRFEEPDFKSRWDMPMFTILPDDDISLVGNEIIGVCLKKSVKQSRATFKPIVCGEGYAMLLDKRTSDVVQSVIAAKNQGRS